jgi:hypothetical protein
VGKQVFIGNTPINKGEKEVKGEFVEVGGEKFYQISNYDTMLPFFMTIISAYDHWLFIASNGGLTAGRKNSDNAIFPYYTDDKIVDNAQNTGSRTVVRLIEKEKIFIWEPFHESMKGMYHVERKLYKNGVGNRIIFQEINRSLNLVFSYEWSTSEKFGFVRSSSLRNLNESRVSLEILDGIQNILPFGVERNLQDIRSTLVDAYKKNELLEETGIGLFSLSSMIVDKAEPSESLKATVAWSCGFENAKYLLSTLQIEQFCIGDEISTETEIKAEKGAYFVNASFLLDSDQSQEWRIVCDVNQSPSAVIGLQHALQENSNMFNVLSLEVEAGTDSIRKKVGQSDGIQLSDDELTIGRHFSNVLFNIMRGGAFEDQYEIDRDDWIRYVRGQNKYVFERSQRFFEGLPASILLGDLRQRVTTNNDVDLRRLFMEYLPLSFSRRHGDPSRPWNQFNIETVDENGDPVRNYEGNWRDIFQNWEALACSFPEFIEGMISRFVNASTIDGYNPYRITRDGIDWERIEEDDPWSFIGYWGDHQIIYLLKLLELSKKFHPSKLNEFLGSDLFVYSNVPYKIRGFDAILMDPKDTIDFDHLLDKKIDDRVADIGADGKMAWNAQSELVRCNLTEKILVTSLTKLYNFIPDAGIWLNTQRPEWNDANNALVGNGTSLVTLYYLRRFCQFTINLFAEQGDKEFEVNKPVADLFDALWRGFNVRKPLLETGFSPEERRKLMDRFGIAGEHYRTSAYSGFLGNKKTLQSSEIVQFFELAQSFLEKSISTNKRPNGLYQAYSLVKLSQSEAFVEPLYDMLEGQVAILSSGLLIPNEALNVLDALKKSEMYREDQYSYMLYPNRELKSFLEKSSIHPDSMSDSSLLKKLMAAENLSLMVKDRENTYRFNGNIKNKADLESVLKHLEASGYANEVDNERDFIADIYERTFNHRAFTGRSGTFFGYEGLGCIYWHMVSKLLLAVQEVIINADNLSADPVIIGRLIDHYYEIRAGIGVNKSPELYGAFPTDAYSHTPSNRGVQQPGMTGQVKEDILNRWAELGIVIQEGYLMFQPILLRRSELMASSQTFNFINLSGANDSINIPENGMAFTFCQTPIIYSVGEEKLTYRIEGKTIESASKNRLGLKESELLFKRKGAIEFIHYQFEPLV